MNSASPPPATRWRARAGRHRPGLALVGIFIAVGMAVLWWVVVPEKAAQTRGLQSALIRYAHPATWALLAVLGVLVATEAPKQIRNAVGAASVACYAAFLVAMVL